LKIETLNHTIYKSGLPARARYFGNL